MYLKTPNKTAVRLQRAGFDKIPLSPTEMRGTLSLPARLFPWLIGGAGYLHDYLIAPRAWSQFANVDAYHILVLVFQAAKALNIPTGGNYQIPSGPVQGDMPENNPPQTLTSHAFEAVVGADNFADIENHVTMKDVLVEIVDVTRTVSPTCE